MFILQASKNNLVVKHREMITSGSVNVYKVKFYFDECWSGFYRKAVFKAGKVSVSVVLDNTNICTIPWEVLEKHNDDLYIGVYGTRNGDIVLPTIWAKAETIKLGTTTSDEPEPPTPDIWEQKLDAKADTLNYDENGELGLYSQDKLLSSVNIPPIYKFGHGLKQDGREISVDMASKDKEDKSLPISAAAVESTVGNIEILLQRI